MAIHASDWLRHFRLLLWNRWTEFNQTWQEARSQHPLPSLCVSGRSEKQDGRPGIWWAETFSNSPLKLLNRIQRNLTGSKISTSSTKFVFFGPIQKTRWPPWPLIGWDIFDFSSETAARNSRKLDRKQDFSVPYQVCVFRLIRKNKMATLASDSLRIFDFSSETAIQISTKLDRKQDLSILSQVCVFRADQKNKMAALASDWLRHFDFSSESPERNSTKLDRKQDLSVLFKFVYFGPVRETRWPPQLLIGWDIFDYSSETAERNSTKLDRNRWTEFNKSDSKQDLNIFYQVCVFRADE